MNPVFVAVWDHRNGTEVRVFSTYEKMCAWRDEIARSGWEDWFDEPMPTENVGDAYFDRMDSVFDAEWLRVDECMIDEV